jgi:uncharacterized lipoprotein NlpE involved in copper resistance
MKKNTFGFSLFMVALLVMGLGSCASNKAVDSAHNSRNSLDWQGIYTGTVPSAGPGIDIRIQLNADETFQLRYEYVDRANSTYNEAGSFTWDKTGNVITLNTKDTDWLRYYKVGENTLTVLDINGNVITGNLADLYVLRKLP